MTLEIIKEAVNRGVVAVNYVKAKTFIYCNGKVVGVQVVDQISGKIKNIYAKRIVNATGPWVDTLREKDNSKKGKYLHLTKGIHIVIDCNRLPLKEAVYFDTPFKDGRMMFAIPRDGKTYIGTTDTTYTADPIHPRMTKEDRDYILQAANYMFPDYYLTSDDVESSWAGVRPLIHEEGKDPSEISRKDEIFLSDSGLITIAGGKLTGYRKMAEKVVDLVGKQNQEEGGNRYPSCSTAHVTLSGGNVGGSDNFTNFVQEKVYEGIQLGLSKEEAKKLVKRYGSNIKFVYEIIRESASEAKEYGLSLEVFASLVYSIENEMVTTPNDFFIRSNRCIIIRYRLGSQMISFDFGYPKGKVRADQIRLDSGFQKCL